MKTLTKTRNFETNNEYRQKVLKIIVGRIEKEIGVGKPTVITHADFEQKQEEIRKNIQDSEHFSEGDWPESHNILLECLGIEPYSNEDEALNIKSGTSR